MALELGVISGNKVHWDSTYLMIRRALKSLSVTHVSSPRLLRRARPHCPPACFQTVGFLSPNNGWRELLL
jgi:hypothetical protein